MTKHDKTYSFRSTARNIIYYESTVKESTKSHISVSLLGSEYGLFSFYCRYMRDSQFCPKRDELTGPG